jgi:hypothetical protein
MISAYNMGEWRWRDRQGLVHAIERHPVQTQRWTSCGLHNVPNGEGWHGTDAVTCPACLFWAEEQVDALSTRDD